MLFIITSAFIPDKKVAIDNDVGITCIMNNQDQILNYVIEIPAIGESDYSCTQELLRSASNQDYVYVTSTNCSMYLVGNYKCLIRQSSTDNNTIDYKEKFRQTD